MATCNLLCLQTASNITSALCFARVHTHRATAGSGRMVHPWGGRGPRWGQVWAVTSPLPLRRIPEGSWEPGSLHSCAGHPSPDAAMSVSWQRGAQPSVHLPLTLAQLHLARATSNICTAILPPWFCPGESCRASSSPHSSFLQSLQNSLWCEHDFGSPDLPRQQCISQPPRRSFKSGCT